jgi:hypothetical protein
MVLGIQRIGTTNRRVGTVDGRSRFPPPIPIIPLTRRHPHLPPGFLSIGICQKISSLLGAEIITGPETTTRGPNTTTVLNNTNNQRRLRLTRILVVIMGMAMEDAAIVLPQHLRLCKETSRCSGSSVKRIELGPLLTTRRALPLNDGTRTSGRETGIAIAIATHKGGITSTAVPVAVDATTTGRGR